MDKMENKLLEIAKQFDKNTVSVEVLANCRNKIYKANCLDYSFVLRLSDEQHRTVTQIESELDFQKYLFDNGADVAKPLQTESGKSCISFKQNNSRFIVSAFEYVTYKDWDERNDQSEETYMLIGKALGKIHKLSKQYNPVNVVKRRLWSEQQELQKAGELFKNYNAALYDKFTDFMQQMGREEKSIDTFGLTHGDYLISNYLIDGNNIKVIDFDECEYSWYAADLAICMRCYLFWTEHPEELPNKAKEAEMMHYNLLLGYSSENKVTKDMVFDLDKYIKIRDYIELAQLLEQTELNDIEKTHFEMCLDRILNNKPFLEFNTEKSERFLLK